MEKICQEDVCTHLFNRMLQTFKNKRTNNGKNTENKEYANNQIPVVSSYLPIT